MHEGHRERMRERYLKEGLDSFQDHEVLELLLYYALARQNTNGLGHQIMEHFGSFEAVFEAPIEELMKVDGIGKSSAILFKLIPDLYRRYLLDKHNIQNKIYSPQDAAEYLIAHYIGFQEEAVTLICLDNRNCVKKISIVGKGSINSTNIDRKKMLSILLASRATAAIISHNHPEGLAKPSRRDVQTTEELVSLFKTIDIHLADHIIIAGEEYYSMSQDRNYALLFSQ